MTLHILETGLEPRAERLIYELAQPLTADAAFHLSSLQRMAARNEAALQTAREALEADPDHLLLLYSGGEAAQALGQEDVAAEYAGRMLEAWDREIGSAKAGYEGITLDLTRIVPTTCGGGGVRRFALSDPLWEDGDRNHVPNKPSKYYSGMMADVRAFAEANGGGE